MLSNRELLAGLVSFDSTSHKSTDEIAAFIRNYADRPSIRLREQGSACGAKTNLIFETGPETGDRSGLTLSGHMDVVPAQEPEWESDPFTLTERDGKLFGRGSCDMKGFDALALNALVAASERDLKAPLALVFTFDEEVGTLGARYFVEHAPEIAASLPTSCIVGEPTSLRVVRMHKGHTKVRVTIRGKSAHSGYPHLGQNAIEGAARIIASLRGLRHRLEKEGGALAGHFPDAPYDTLAVTMIDGGAAVNIIPDRCDVMVSLRLMPRASRDEVMQRLTAACNHAAGDDPIEVHDGGESPALFLDESTAIYQSLTALVDQTDTATAMYATDGGWLARAGMECAVWGPGSITVAHKPNEFMPIDEFERGGELLDRVVREYCG